MQASLLFSYLFFLALSHQALSIAPAAPWSECQHLIQAATRKQFETWLGAFWARITIDTENNFSFNPFLMKINRHHPGQSRGRYEKFSRVWDPSRYWKKQNRSLASRIVQSTPRSTPRLRHPVPWLQHRGCDLLTHLTPAVAFRLWGDHVQRNKPSFINRF
jgi:hypothetical protein